MTFTPPDDDIAEPEAPPPRPLINRRSVLAGGVVAAAGAAGLYAAARPSPLPRNAKGQRKITLAWNANAICLAPALLAKEQGIYERFGLDVELMNFAGSTDQLLEAISTGKADAGVGMILRWIKPLEQGFDVRLIAGTHGGCIRVLGSRRAGITDAVESLRGKAIGLSEITGAGRNALAVLLKANGLDPNRDVEWKAFPAPLLAAAVEKGEIQAFVDSDPIAYVLQKNSGGDLVEVLSNLSAPWQDRVCCVLGASGDLLRRDRASGVALAQALTTAASICSQQPEAVARAFAPYAKASVEDLVAVLKMQTHDHHPVGRDLHREVALYAGELRDVGVMKPTTDPQSFASRTVEQLFA
ncbi:ABC transporter substrate-binding protein [Novosphingobium resinovorum]|uniref:ABC transporter substrate-binding protein n=1 Tax=Novosphingobium resinovorum TaxID=158500 RepID=A0A1D8AC67_9SPHN|nr:ABC transporter substrate-binding protein [Novosphingobium resinovorum]AOR79700.1 ABC transporter substrate-binding protein [Novosphingobium resinovorum]